MEKIISVDKIMKKRYTAKHYDSSRRIPREELAVLLEALRLSPTSVNAQLNRFFVASTKEAREKVAASMMDFNVPRVVDASDVVVFAIKTEADDEHLKRVLAKEVEDGRFPDPEFARMQDEGRRGFIDLNAKGQGIESWAARQSYIAMGVLLTMAPLLGIDATPIEGLHTDKLDEILGLREKGLKSLAVVSLGYHAAGDSNATRPKSRLALEEVVEVI